MLLLLLYFLVLFILVFFFWMMENVKLLMILMFWLSMVFDFSLKDFLIFCKGLMNLSVIMMFVVLKVLVKSLFGKLGVNVFIFMLNFILYIEFSVIFMSSFWKKNVCNCKFFSSLSKYVLFYL